MADNFLERQYAAYEERKAAMKSGKKPASKTKVFYPTWKGRKTVSETDENYFPREEKKISRGETQKKPWSKILFLAPGLIVSHKRFCGD